MYRGHSVAVLTSSLQDNYYHWLMEVLPRIQMIRSQELRPDRIFVQAKTRFQAETLRLLGITKEQILSTAECELVRAQNLMVPFHEIGAGMEHPPWVCSFLRNSFLPYVADGRSDNSATRLYISREGAQWRRVTNETAVIAFLERFGFRKVQLETMPFLDQVGLFHHAKVIVAPHGAALANLVFSQRGTKVFDLQPWKLQDLFFSLSRSVGAHYYYVKSSTGPANPVNNQQQITIDLRELETTLLRARID